MVRLQGGPEVRVDRVSVVADLRMLGPLQVVDDAGPMLNLPGARPRGLLAVLALGAPGIVATDTILEMLWGDEKVARPEAALHTTVNRLRKALGEGLIDTCPPSEERRWPNPAGASSSLQPPTTSMRQVGPSARASRLSRVMSVACMASAKAT